MALTRHDAIVEVTVDGSGFDTPSEITYTNEGEVPTCTLVFPAGLNSRYKVLKSNIVRVYVGLDDIPDTPQFTGHMDEDGGKVATKLDLVGSLNRAVDDKRFVTDYDNFDGLEISDAILKVFEEVSELSFMTPLVEATSPTVVVPDGLRWENGISKYDLMKTFRDLGVDSTDPLKLGKYTFFQHGDFFHFRKIPDPSLTSPWVELAYGDTLLDYVPEASNRFSYNKSRVIGKDGATGEFENTHRIAIDGLSEADIISDENIPNGGEAYETARATVLSNMVNQTGLQANSHLLLEMMPNFAVIEVTGAPYGLSDKYLVKVLNMVVNEGAFDISAKVAVPIDILSDAISQLVNVSGGGSSALALQ